MNTIPAILADSDLVKLIFMIGAVALFIIGGLISQAKMKEKEQAERQRHQENWGRIEDQMRERAAAAARDPSRARAYPRATPPPVPPYAPPPYAPPPPPPPVFVPTRSIDGPYVPPRPAARRPVPPRMAPMPPKAVPVARTQPPPQPRRQKQKKAARLPPAPPMAPAAALPPALPAAARAGDAPAARAGQPLSANAAALSRWLNGKTLRSQFILTEILQPPLALRDRAL